MDSRLVNERAEAFKDRTIRLTPAHFDQLGLEKKNINLRIEEFRISCIPFDLSLSKASLLAFLSDREVEFFRKMVSAPQKLSVTWKSPYSVKPVDFFLLCRILDFRKADPASTYCFIDVVFSPASAPLAFKELLVSYFQGSDDAERFFNDAPEEPLSDEQIQKALGSLHLTVISEPKAAERLRIVALSPRTLKVFGEFEDPIPKPGDAMEFEPCGGNAACTLKGECTEVLPSAEAPLFAAASFKLQFSAFTEGKMKEAVGWGSKSGRQAKG
jgi:hypothetical protein